VCRSSSGRPMPPRHARSAQASGRARSDTPRADDQVPHLWTYPRWPKEHPDQGGHTDRWGDDARRAGAPAVIPLPGHTPGSVAYQVPSVDAIFMGDAMTTRSVTTGIVGPALAPFTVDPAMALASLAALDGLSANWVLPGHGDAWTGGVPEALRLIRAARAKRAA
jgi:glyoxylase-like metal-dependent hydrolase (beta-lactamase superfamily II)